MRCLLWINGTSTTVQKRKKALEDAGYRIEPADTYSYYIEFESAEDVFRVKDAVSCKVTIGRNHMELGVSTC